MEDSFVESAASVFLLSSPKEHKETGESDEACESEVIFSSLKSNQVSQDLKIKFPLFLHTTFLSSNKLLFVLSNGLKLWKGELSQAELERNADELNESVTNYIITAKNALGNYTGNLSISIKNGNETDNVELSWDRILEDNSAYTLGSTNLWVSTESNAVAAFIKNSCCFTEKLQTDLKLANVKQQKLSSQNKRLQTELEKCSQIKTELECNLLNKFVQILNEKKAKIKSLEDEIIQLRSKQADLIESDVPVSAVENKEKAEGSSCEKKETGRRRKIIMSSLEDSDSFLSSSPPKARKVMPPMIRPEDVPPVPAEASDDLPDTVPNAIDMLDEM